MKKFILKSFLLSCLIFLIAYPADLVLSGILKNSNGPGGEYQVWNDIYNSNIDVDLAIYGSSRAWVHIDPSILQDSLGITAYNFGINGHSFWLQYLRHLEYIKQNTHPSTIVLSVDIFSLAKRKDLFNYRQFLPYMLWKKNVKSYTGSYVGFENMDYLLPLIRFKGESEFVKKMYRRRKRAPFRNLGYRGNEKKWDSLLEKETKKKKSYESRIDSASVKLFHQFVKECKNNNINLIFVYTPEHISGQKFVKNRTEIINIFKNTARKNNIPFLNYSDDTINVDRAHFYNALHLNREGAELFTSKLSEDLKPFLMLNKEE